MLLKRLLFAVLTGSSVVVASSCNDPFQLQPAAIPNFVDTVTVYALQGTEISLPSGYDVAGMTLARTDRGDPFDITFDIDDAGLARIFPQGALGLDPQSGVIRADRPFDDIQEAPTEGYSLDSSLVVDLDSTFVVRSRGFSGSGAFNGDDCPFFIGALPRYGKFRVIVLDRTARFITMESLVNVNCGYRGLQPGWMPYSCWAGTGCPSTPWEGMR